jgi:hypothetical protein
MAKKKELATGKPTVIEKSYKSKKLFKDRFFKYNG